MLDSIYASLKFVNLAEILGVCGLVRDLVGVGEYPALVLRVSTTTDSIDELFVVADQRSPVPLTEVSLLIFQSICHGPACGAVLAVTVAHILVLELSVWTVHTVLTRRAWWVGGDSADALVASHANPQLACSP